MRVSKTPNAASPTVPARAKRERLGRRPARARALRDRVDDRAEARRREHRAAQVQSAPAGLLHVAGNDLQRGEGERNRHGQVHEEDHPPVGELRQEPTGEDADRRTGAADGTPGGKRLRLCRPVEAGRDDRERSRGEHRRAETLTGPRREERGGGSGERRGEGRGREDPEAGEEEAAAPEQVGGAAAEEQEAPEDEGVARDRPADLRAGELQVLREARQRDVHGRDVEDDHQLRDEEHEQQGCAFPARSGVAAGGPRRLVVALLAMHGVPPDKLDVAV